MKLFISWSGESSLALAKCLRDWIPKVLQDVEPWLSHEDIDAGACWSSEISRNLDESDFGVVCLTHDNLASQWIAFEAGACAKHIKKSRVVPLLLNLEFIDIKGPLAGFQAKKVNRSDIQALVNSINRANNNKLPIDRLNDIFSTFWPELESRVNQIQITKNREIVKRTKEDLLEELVLRTRLIESKVDEIFINQVPEAKSDHYYFNIHSLIAQHISFSFSSRCPKAELEDIHFDDPISKVFVLYNGSLPVEIRNALFAWIWIKAKYKAVFVPTPDKLTEDDVYSDDTSKHEGG